MFIGLPVDNINHEHIRKLDNDGQDWVNQPAPKQVDLVAIVAVREEDQS